MEAEPSGTPSLIRLTTDAVEERHRVSLLGDVMARALAGGHITAALDQPVTCDWTLAPLGPGTVMGFGSSGRFAATRDKAMLRDGDDDVSLFFVGRGTVPFEQNDRRVLLAPGHALVVAHGRAVRSNWLDSDAMVLRLPRAALTGLDLEALGGMTLDLTMPIMRLLSAYLDALKPLTLEQAAPGVAARHLGELARAAIAEALGAASDKKAGAGVQAARLAAMREAILTRYHNPALSMAKVAALIGISERAGYAVFEAAGLSFSDTVYAVRLDRAYEQLRAGHTGSLLSLAQGVGFVDQAHFNRRFRHRFGCAPREVTGNSSREHSG